MLNIGAVKRVAYVYLAIPLVLFASGWLNYAAAAVLCLLLVAALVEIWRSTAGASLPGMPWRGVVATLLIVAVWVLLSGVGGYMFQNWDHHSRNAVFHDLITYQWPVVYHLDAAVVGQYHIPDRLMLSYYFGFWLPAALVGKLFGWGAANFALFLWTCLGVLLIVLLTAAKLHVRSWKAALLLIFFSGMDVLGVLLLRNVAGYTYPTFWPPIQHLEWWAGSVQYSAFTTELFWTYNQFVPALLVAALLMLDGDARSALFLGGLCAFYAPFPAAGLLPFLGGIMLRDVMRAARNFGALRLGSVLRPFVTFQNFVGVLVGGISFLLFMTNLAGQSRSFGLPAPIALYLIFVLLEGMLIWLWLLPVRKRDWIWYVAGILLLIAPFINIGGSWDFMMRVTIPALYVLMLGAGDFLATHEKVAPRVVLLCLLCLGALTPLYEMNRSIVRTVRYYRWPVVSGLALDGYFAHPPETNQALVPEFDHPSTLVADDWGTVINPAYEGWNTKAGHLFGPVWRWLWRDSLILR